MKPGPEKAMTWPWKPVSLGTSGQPTSSFLSKREGLNLGQSHVKIPQECSRRARLSSGGENKEKHTSCIAFHGNHTLSLMWVWGQNSLFMCVLKSYRNSKLAHMG